MNPELNCVWDVRTYSLRQGEGKAFQELFTRTALPMLLQHGIDVIASGLSLRNDDSFVLIRAFDSLEQRELQLGAFYGSKEWLTRYDQTVMNMIQSYQVVVIPAPIAASYGDKKA